MIKQSIIFVLLSIVVVFLKGLLAQVLHFLLLIQEKINAWLSMIFSHDTVGGIIHGVLSLIVLPVIIGIIVAIFLRLIQRQVMPNAFIVIWAVWFILLISILLPAA